MPEELSNITIISDLLKRDPAYKQVIDQLEERLYNRYMVYLSDKPKFNTKTSLIPKPYLNIILSFKNTLGLNAIAKKYNLSQEQRDGIPPILWRIFFREAEIKNLPQMINTELKINSIRTAYQISTDIANLYLPISDYLGDIPMVIKKWQYEMPVSEPTISELITKRPTTNNTQQTTKDTQKIVSKIQPTTQIQTTDDRQPTTENIQQTAQIQTTNDLRPTTEMQTQRTTQTTTNNTQPAIKDESIPKVQEALSRIAAASNRISEQTRISREASQVAIQPQVPVTTPPAVMTPAEPQPIAMPAQPQQMPIATQSHSSDLEPEYLPDEPKQSVPIVNRANVIDLKER